MPAHDIHFLQSLGVRGIAEAVAASGQAGKQPRG